MASSDFDLASSAILCLSQLAQLFGGEHHPSLTRRHLELYSRALTAEASPDVRKSVRGQHVRTILRTLKRLAMIGGGGKEKRRSKKSEQVSFWIWAWLTKMSAWKGYVAKFILEFFLTGGGRISGRWGDKWRIEFTRRTLSYVASGGFTCWCSLSVFGKGNYWSRAGKMNEREKKECMNPALPWLLLP